MNRRTFFKIFPLAGLAAAFGIKLKAEPEFIYYTKAADIARGRHMMIDEMNFENEIVSQDEMIKAGLKITAIF